MPLDKDTVEILKSVHDFYDAAWNKLVIAGGVFLSVGAIIVGIVVPIAIQRWQNKQLGLREKELEKEMEVQFKDLEEKLIAKLQEAQKAEIQKVTAKMKVIESQALAQSLHIQGNYYFESKRFKMAFVAYLDAVNHYSYTESLTNLKKCLDRIAQSLKHLDEETYKELVVIKRINIENTLERALATDSKDLLNQSVNYIREEVARLKPLGSKLI